MLTEYLDIYGVSNCSLDCNSAPHMVEIDTIVHQGRTVRLYTAVVYFPDHHKLHKKFLKAYYANKWAGAVFLARQLKADGPTEMRQYYINMIDRMEAGNN